MDRQRNAAFLDRTAGRLWLTDGGLETAMVFHEGLELPHFASFPLLDDARGRDALARYFARFLDLAACFGTGFVLDTLTWRASHGWGAVMGLSEAEVDTANRRAAAFARELRDRRGAQAADIVLNGILGPHGDAYAPDRRLTAAEAEAYYARPIRVLAGAGVEVVTAMTLGDTGPAIGIARAAAAAGVPSVIGFTVETDGRPVTGQPLGEAIEETDAATAGAPAWFMVNCAHPEHFRPALSGAWVARIGAVRANASCRSHAELDEATELDIGDIPGLAGHCRALLDILPGLRVLGGCCGTDQRHIEAIAAACLPTARAA